MPEKSIEIKGFEVKAFDATERTGILGTCDRCALLWGSASPAPRG
jgi:hypothetical protein